MENVTLFAVAFVSVKDIIILCLKLEGKWLFTHFEGNVIQGIIRCQYLSSLSV